jgi:hypothetical protein
MLQFRFTFVSCRAIRRIARSAQSWALEKGYSWLGANPAPWTSAKLVTSWVHATSLLA